MRRYLLKIGVFSRKPIKIPSDERRLLLGRKCADKVVEELAQSPVVVFGCDGICVGNALCQLVEKCLHASVALLSVIAAPAVDRKSADNF